MHMSDFEFNERLKEITKLRRDLELQGSELRSTRECLAGVLRELDECRRDNRNLRRELVCVVRDLDESQRDVAKPEVTDGDS
jgi:septal ring factor EnvC (AmiA/AmiB activator)